MTPNAEAKNKNLLSIFICKKNEKSGSKIGRAKAILVQRDFQDFHKKLEMKVPYKVSLKSEKIDNHMGKNCKFLRPIML